MKNKKVFVLMSGGVDSSVAAALLENQGCNVFGIHLKLSEFCDEKDEYDARRVCQILSIPYYVIDISEEYEKTVSLDTIKKYKVGLTPNPDVLCNKLIKFGYVFDKLQKIGMNYIATGHYARLWREIPNSPPALLRNAKRAGKFQIPNYQLLTAKDKNKDQSYFLWGIKKNRLKNLLFPIGDYLKKDVRKIAKKFNLPNANKKDSQGICFLGKISLSDYLREFLKEKKGNIVDSKGNILGEHKGHWFFTEGQRHGLDIKTGKGPYFVAKKEPKKNLIIVAKENEKILYTKQIKLKNLNWLVNLANIHEFSANIINNPFKIFVRCRYRQPLQKAIFDVKKAILEFEKPQKAIAKGQSAVFYKKLGKDNYQLLGGGIIK